MSDEEIMHDDIDDGKSMKLSRYDIDPQYNDPDPDYRPRNESVLPVEPTSAQILTPALQDDALHPNDAVYGLWAEAWRDAIVAARWA